MNLKVDGHNYDINQQMKKLMKFIEEGQALNPNEEIDIDGSIISRPTFEELVKILVDLKYEIPVFNKIKTADLKEVVGAQLADILNKKSVQEINELYRAAHYLKIEDLQRCIAATMSCKVFIKNDLDSYNKKKTHLKLTNELDSVKSKEYKEKYPFIN